jgi:hypothetical protein
VSIHKRDFYVISTPLKNIKLLINKRFYRFEIGVQRFSFGRFLESKASALGVFWSPKLQHWAYFGVQSFSFGCILEFNALALGVFWSPTF